MPKENICLLDEETQKKYENSELDEKTKKDIEATLEVLDWFNDKKTSNESPDKKEEK